MSSSQGHVYAGDSYSYGGPILQGNITGNVHLAFSRDVTSNDQDVYDWLSPLNFWNTQVDVYDRWHEGTAGWFLDHPSVRHWIEDSGENLFCTGKPGVGKTMLSSVLVHHLHEKFARKGLVAVVVVYCNFKSESSLDVPNLVSSLVQQLAWQEVRLSEEFKTIYSEYSRRRMRPTVSKWRQLLHSTVEKFTKVYLVVDALDELTKESVRTKFIEIIKELPQKASILVTSRDIPHVSHKFQDWLHVGILAQKADVFSYLSAAIKASTEVDHFVQVDPSLEDEILNRVWENSCRTFLLPQLHIQSITRADSRQGVKNALEFLPLDIEISYDDVMKRIERQKKNDYNRAINVLMWLTFTCRPLHVYELQYALVMQSTNQLPGRDALPAITRLISVCAGMVIVESGSRLARLAHETAQSYFESYLLKKVPHAHQIIAETCIAHLQFDNFAEGPCHSDEDFRIRLKEFPLYGYASRFWGFHASKALNITMASLCKVFLKETKKLAAAAQAAYAPPSLSSFYPQPIDPIWISASFGLTLDLSLLSQNQGQASPSSFYMALYFAKQTGHLSELEALCKELQTKGLWVDPSRLGPWKLGDMILHHAINHGHDSILKILLEEGADPNYYIHDDDRCSSPLYMAISEGRVGAVKLLLDAGANPSIGMGSKSSLFRSVEMGDNAVVQLLLDAGADPDDSWVGETAIEWAADKGYASIVETLLNARGTATLTALKHARWRNNWDLVKMFLNWVDGKEYLHPPETAPPTKFECFRHPSTDVPRSSQPKTAIAATPVWEFEVFREPEFDNRQFIECFEDRPFTFSGINRLLERHIQQEGDMLEKRHIEQERLTLQKRIIRLCLQKGADVNGNYRFSPLLKAASCGSAEVVSLLLDRGANVKVRDGNNCTALHRAVKRPLDDILNGGLNYDRERIINMLIEAKINERVRSSHGKTAWEIEDEAIKRVKDRSLRERLVHQIAIRPRVD